MSDQTGPGPEQPTRTIRAAEYARMSTEHQQYSIENQSDAIRQYAAKRGMIIVRTYADSGKSGLRIDGREALQQLIRDVEHGKADFEVILVYDVSRWGRFQDADESAYYEYICRRAGIGVHYCAEQFDNDGSPVATIVKGVKRAMAGEYSRELSAKVFAGQCRLIELGYRQGGAPGLGLRRMLLDQAGNQKGVLTHREQKSIQTDRVVLVPGPPEEVEVVNRVYRMFVEESRVESEIARALNAEGIRTDLGREWTRGSIHQMLTNPKYAGDNVYNRVSFKLKKKRVVNPPDMWIRRNGAYEAIVDPSLFYMAQGILRERNRRFSDAEMLDRLKSLWEKEGRLSGFLIDECEGMPASTAYRSRFKSLVRAYRLVGYTPERDYAFLETNQRLRAMYPGVVADVTGKIEALGAHIERDTATDILKINREFTASLVIARCRFTGAGSLRWLIRLDTGLQPDITVAIRMNPSNSDPLDYYLLPSIDLTPRRLRLAEDNCLSLDSYRFPTLDYFFGMAERARIQEAA
ncbi:MAG: recombinase family protein [Bryobacterales bacterium]|nr:recombinase family protein [Bryobacterales bacterium]